MCRKLLFARRPLHRRLVPDDGDFTAGDRRRGIGRRRLCGRSAAYPRQHANRKLASSVRRNRSRGICQWPSGWPDGVREAQSGSLHSPDREGGGKCTD